MRWRELFDQAVDQKGQSAVGRELGYDKSTINQVRHNTYKGSTDNIAAKVMEVFGRGEAMEEKVPEGYKKDGLGRLIPVESIRIIDLARDELVREIVTRATEQAKTIAKFKSSIMDDIQAFVELSAEKYDTRMGGIKGNVSLTSFDGKYKVVRAISEHLVFDERLQVAKQLIDECINKWAKGSRSEIRALINDAFQPDKPSKINTARILGLRRLDITDEKWLRAMDAISESLQVAGSRAYIRIYERKGNTDKYERLNLDLVTAE